MVRCQGACPGCSKSWVQASTPQAKTKVLHRELAPCEKHNFEQGLLQSAPAPQTITAGALQLHMAASLLHSPFRQALYLPVYFRIKNVFSFIASTCSSCFKQAHDLCGPTQPLLLFITVTLKVSISLFSCCKGKPGLLLFLTPQHIVSSKGSLWFGCT